MKRPTYPWFDQVPDHLKTRNQLGELGLKPGGPIAAEVRWDRGKKVAYLYDVAQAVAKRPLSAKARAAVESQKLARRTCLVCRRVFDDIVWNGLCEECYDYKPNGTPRHYDDYFQVHDVKPYVYRVWLPMDVAPGPRAVPVPVTMRYYHWIPYPKVEFRLVMSDRETGPLLPNHTHAWHYGRPIADLLAEWSHAEFAALAAIWPMLRGWAIDASLPGDAYLDHALAGLDAAGQAELRTEWYVRRSTYHRDLRAIEGT